MPESMPRFEKLAGRNLTTQEQGVYYLSDHFRVRSSFKRDGSLVFVLERPKGKKGGSVLQKFEFAYEAIFIAGHCDDNFDGSYSAEARKDAKRAYDEVIQHVQP